MATFFASPCDDRLGGGLGAICPVGGVLIFAMSKVGFHHPRIIKKAATYQSRMGLKTVLLAPDEIRWKKKQ
jgi:hypothetical protein